MSIDQPGFTEEEAALSGAERFRDAVLSRWGGAPRRRPDEAFFFDGQEGAYREDGGFAEGPEEGPYEEEPQQLRVLSEDPLYKKTVMILTGVSLLLYLAAAVGKGGSWLSLIAPAIFLALVFLDHPLDSIPMAVPFSVFFVVGVAVLFKTTSGWGILCLLFTLLAAVVFWLLALRQALPFRTAFYLLIALVAVRAVFGFVGFFLALRTGFLAALPELAAFLFAGACAAALWFAGEHLIRRGAGAAPEL